MSSEHSAQSFSRVNMFYQNHLLKVRGLSHASLHKSDSDFFRKSTVDFHVIPDSNLAEERRKPSIDDELILSMYNDLLEVIVDTWDEKSAVKYFKKPEPIPNYCDTSVKSSSLSSSRESGQNGSKTSAGSRRSSLKKKEVKNKKDSKRTSLSSYQTSSEILRTEREILSQNLEDVTSPLETLIEEPLNNDLKGSNQNDAPQHVFPDSLTQSHMSSLEPLPDWKPVISDEDCTITFKNGGMYIGRVSRKGMEGKGLYRWSNGTIYQGEFFDNLPHGFGSYTWSDMSYYEGQVYQGFRHGNGFFVGPPAEPDLPRIYMSGTWNLGKLVGKGNLKQGSQLYEGTFENSVRTGKGIRYYDPNSVYAGDFINGIRDGNGTMVWENNDVYIGNWKNGLRHGYGEYIWEAYLYPEICFFNQNFYYGNWKENLRHGFGTLTLNNGCLYDGSWHDDIKHGTGLIVCKNGLIIKSEQLYYKNRPAMIKGSKNVNEDISENDNRSKKKVITKSSKTKSRQSSPSTKSKAKGQNQKPKKSLSKKLLHSDYSKIERAMIQEVEKQLLYNRTSYSDNEFKPRSLPFHLPDHYIILEYHLNRLMHNTPEQSKFKSNRIVNLDYSPTTSFHTAPFYDSHSNIFNLKIGDCIQKSPEITAKFNKDNLETIASSCADRFCTSALRESEECNLRNMIIYHMHLLRKVYNFYASLGINDKLPLNSEPVLVRLFLWQLFRDCGLSRRGINLIQLDRDLSINVSSCLLSDHNPFEKLQFFQFLHCLLEASWCLYGKYMNIHNYKEGVLAVAFDTFLMDDVAPAIENRNGYALSEFRNRVPLHTMYSMYKRLGEPLTIRNLIYTIQKQGIEEESIEISYEQVQFGYQGILGDDVIYYPKPPDSILENSVESTDQGPLCNLDLIDLKLLKDLNMKDLLICCAEICPTIICKDEIVNIDYEINFLEFYEIIIICTDRIFYNEDYDKWKELENARIAELENLVKIIEKPVKEKKVKKGK